MILSDLFGDAKELAGGFSVIKKSITELSPILSKMRDWDTWSDGTFKDKSPILAEYVEQVKDLSLSEAEIALSTQKLSAVQKEQILTESGLIASKKVLNIQQQKELLTSGLITKADIDRAVSLGVLKIGTEGQLIATKNLTAAEVEQMLIEEGMDAIAAKHIASTYAQTGATGLLTKAVIALNTAWALNPTNVIVAGITAIVAAIVAVTGGIHIYKNSVKGAIEENKKLIDSNKKVRDSLSEEISDNKNNAEDLQSLYEDYMTAKKGSDEYYKAANAIAELSKVLVVGYDNEGNAILANNDKIKEQIQYYKDMAKAKQEALRYEALGDINEEQASYQEIKQKKDEQQKRVDEAKKVVDEYQAIYDQSGDQQDLDDLNLLKSEYYDMVSDLSLLSAQLGEAETSLRENYTNLLPLTDNLTEAQKAMRSGLIDAAVAEGFSPDKFDKVFAELEEVDASGIINLQLDKSLTAEEYRTQALNIYENLAAQFKLTDDAKQAFKVAFGIDDESIKNAEETKRNNISLIGEKLGNNIDKDDSSWSEDKDIEEWINSLSEEEVALILSGQFDENTTLLEMQELLEELQEEANKKPIKTEVQVLSGVESLSTGLDQLKEIYSDVLDGKEFDFSSILNNEDFKKSFGDYTEEYENFIKTIASSPTDITACQSAFNSLASAYINNKTALEDVTEETKEATIAMLRQMGVANAKDVVEAKLLNKAKELAAQEEFLAQIGKKLEKATFEEIEAFLNQDDVLEETKAQIRKFAMEKYNANNVHLSTATDIANLKGLVKGLGGATKALDILNRLKAGEKLNIGGKAGYDAIVKQAQAEIDAAYNTINEQAEVNVDLKFDGGDSAEKVKETYDWIETLLSRIQRTITNLGKKVSATYRTWIDRNNAVKDSIAELNKEYQKQGEAAAYYENKAKSVGLNEAYAKKVREGDMSVQDNVTDEALKEKIQKYQEYYEKYLAAVDREEDILAELASNYQQAFDLIASEYDAKIGVIEHDKSMIDGMISQAETSGYIVSKAYYEAMIKAEEGNYAALIDKRNKLQNYLSQAVKNGTIKEGTQDWYDMQASINEVNQAIQDSNTSIIEFGNNIRETEWELFDMERDYVENIRDEISFFIDLMDSGKLFDEKGNMTSLGEATAGLHTVSYNTYLADAEAYAEEILDINKQIAEDQYNQDLLERREELLELQRESILAAQDEKEAIKDMISDGYDVFLDYLQEVIDNRKEAMNEISDLQDFEKSIAEQTSTIADYKKQLAAFEGDDSEETQAKVQQLRVSLEEAEKALAESEYEQWKKDQTQMLDSLYDETQSWINERLDNIDGLVQEVVDSTNIKADEIKQTLTQEAENVGISLSDSLSSIWSNDNGNNVVSTNIADATTTVNTTLLSIAGYLEGMAEHLGVEAKTQVNADSNNAGNTNSSSNGGATVVAPTTGNNNTQSSTVATTWGSWFIEKAFNGSDKSLNIDTSIVDRLKWKDKDSSFSARAQYYSAMGGKGTYTGSASQNTWMLSEMKKNGFSKGGTIGSLIQGAGEDGFVLARTGEEILSIEKIRELRGAFEAMTPVIDSLKPMVVPTLRNNNNTNTINDLHVGFTLPGVNNYEDFVSKIQSDTRFGKIIDQMVFGKMRGDNSLSKYKY